jgi:hypothetical protein
VKGKPKPPVYHAHFAGGIENADGLATSPLFRLSLLNPHRDAFFAEDLEQVIEAGPEILAVRAKRQGGTSTPVFTPSVLAVKSVFHLCPSVAKASSR